MLMNTFRITLPRHDKRTCDFIQSQPENLRRVHRTRVPPSLPFFKAQKSMLASSSVQYTDLHNESCPRSVQLHGSEFLRSCSVMKSCNCDYCMEKIISGNAAQEIKASQQEKIAGQYFQNYTYVTKNLMLKECVA